VRNCAMNGRSWTWDPLNSGCLCIDCRLGGRSPAGGAGPAAFASAAVAVARAVFVLVNAVLRVTMVALSHSRSVSMAQYLASSPCPSVSKASPSSVSASRSSVSASRSSASVSLALVRF